MTSLEEIVALVVREVVSELSKRGFQIDDKFLNIVPSQQKMKINIGNFKTPLLTEANILELGLEIQEIEIPEKTVITPSAQDLIRKRKIKVIKN